MNAIYGQRIAGAASRTTPITLVTNYDSPLWPYLNTRVVEPTALYDGACLSADWDDVLIKPRLSFADYGGADWHIYAPRVNLDPNNDPFGLSYADVQLDTGSGQLNYPVLAVNQKDERFTTPDLTERALCCYTKKQLGGNPDANPMKILSYPNGVDVWNDVSPAANLWSDFNVPGLAARAFGAARMCHSQYDTYYYESSPGYHGDRLITNAGPGASNGGTIKRSAMHAQKAYRDNLFAGYYLSGGYLDIMQLAP